MNILIVKLNAAGDVVRTTPLLRRLRADVTWITAAANLQLLKGAYPDLRCFSWEDRESAADRPFDLVINLEDELEPAAFVHHGIRHDRHFGAYLDDSGAVAYTDDSRGWFDMSLISVHGRKRADELKLQNRRSYQELLFEGLGLRFAGERYALPEPGPGGLCGDVAIAPVAGPVWPMKNWDHYEALQELLEASGLRVNALPRRPTMLEHMGDINSHRCLVGGDSLPMHLAIGLGKRCVTLFNCTSPWEIYDYGIQTKIVSPLLEKFFYQRGVDSAATSVIDLNEVFNVVMSTVEVADPLPLVERQ